MIGAEAANEGDAESFGEFDGVKGRAGAGNEGGNPELRGFQYHLGGQSSGGVKNRIGGR